MSISSRLLEPKPAHPSCLVLIINSTGSQNAACRHQASSVQARRRFRGSPVFLHGRRGHSVAVGPERLFQSTAMDLSRNVPTLIIRMQPGRTIRQTHHKSRIRLNCDAREEQRLPNAFACSQVFLGPTRSHLLGFPPSRRVASQPK